MTDNKSRYLWRRAPYDLTRQMQMQIMGQPHGNFTVYDTQDSLVAWWRLNENSTITTDVPGGTVIDDSGNGNHGSYYAEGSYVPTFTDQSSPMTNLFSHSIEFYDGSNDLGYAKLGTTIGALSSGDPSWNMYEKSWTISVWCKRYDVLPAATEGYWLFVLAGEPESQYGHVGVRIGTDNNLGLDISASHVLGGAGIADIETSMDDTQWHLVTVTYSSPTSLFSFYVDGELIGTKTEAHGLSTSDIFILGAELDNTTSVADAGDSMWQGSIGAVGLWGTALSADNVTSLYSAYLGNIFELQRDYHIRGSQATLSGSIDRFRQGTSIKTLQQQQGGLIPKISSAGRTKLLFGGKEASDTQFDESRLTSDLESDRVTEVPTHEFDFRDLGQPKTYLDDGSYSDLAKYSSVDYLSIENYQLPTSLLDVSDYRLMEAAIEPLTIRTSISFSSTYHPFEAHDAWGALQGGYAEDVHRTYTKLTDKIDWRANLTWLPDSDSWTPESSPHVAFSHAIPPFVDGQTTMTSHPSFFKGLPVTDDLKAGKSNLSLPGYVSEDSSAAYPYHDMTKSDHSILMLKDRIGSRTGLTSSPRNDSLVWDDGSLHNAIYEMSGFDDEHLSFHRARTGFTFYHGTDSLAFGGRKPPRRWMRSYIDFDPRSPLSGSHEAQGTNPPAGSGRVDNYPVLTSGHDYPLGKQSVYLNDDWASSPENVLLKDWETNTWALVFAAEFLSVMNPADKRWLQFRHKVHGSVKIKFDIVAASGNTTYQGIKSYYLKTDGIDTLDPTEHTEDFAIQYSVDNGVTWVNAELYDHGDYNEDTYIHVSKLIQDPTGIGAPYLVRIAQITFSGNLGNYDNYALRKVYLEERFGPFPRSGLRSLPARLQLDEISNRLGRYPTIRRMGDHDRSGVSNVHFDDTNTVVFHDGRAKAYISFYDRPSDAAKLTFTDALGNTSTLEFNHGIIVQPGNIEVRTHGMDDDPLAVAISFISSVKKARDQYGLQMIAELTGETGRYGQRPGSVTVALTQVYPGTSGNTAITTTSSPNTMRHVVTGALGENSAHVTNSFAGGVNHDMSPSLFSPMGSNPWMGNNYGSNADDSKDWFYTKSSIQSGPLFDDFHDPVGFNRPIHRGDMTRGVVDTNLKIVQPSSDMLSPFNETRVPIAEEKFFREGTPEDDIPGFSSRLASKTSIVIPFNVANDKHMYFSTGSTHASNATSKGVWGRPYEKNTGYGYFNWNENTWGILGADGHTNTAEMDYIASFNDAAGAHFVQPIKTPMHTVQTSSLVPFLPSDLSEPGMNPLSKVVGNVTTSYAFPYGKQYHATGSFLLNISDYITRPFLLEKVSLEFHAEFEGSRYMSASAGPIVRHFFILNQHDLPGDAGYAVSGSHPADDKSYGKKDEPYKWLWGSYTNKWNTPFERAELAKYPGNWLKAPRLNIDVNRYRDLVWHGQISLYPEETNNPNYPAQGYEANTVTGKKITKFPKSYERDLNITSPISALTRVRGDSTVILPPVATLGDYLGPVSGTFSLNAPCRVEGGSLYSWEAAPSPMGVQSVRTQMFAPGGYNHTDPDNIVPNAQWKTLYNTAGTRTGIVPDPSGGRGYRTHVGHSHDQSSRLLSGTLIDATMIHDESNPYDNTNGEYYAAGVILTSTHTGSAENRGYFRPGKESAPLEKSVISPYMLMPGDKLALGFYAAPSFFLARHTPVTYYGNTAGPNEGDFAIEGGPKGSVVGYEDRLAEQRTTLKAGEWKLVLYGSLVKEGKEFHEGRNQPLTSYAIHESLHHDNPVIDQFQLSSVYDSEGSYTEQTVTGSMFQTFTYSGAQEVPNSARRIVGSQANSTTGVTGSFSKFVRLYDNSTLCYDSMPPSVKEMSDLADSDSDLAYKHNYWKPLQHRRDTDFTGVPSTYGAGGETNSAIKSSGGPVVWAGVLMSGAALGGGEGWTDNGTAGTPGWNLDAAEDSSGEGAFRGRIGSAIADSGTNNSLGIRTFIERIRKFPYVTNPARQAKREVFQIDLGNYWQAATSTTGGHFLDGDESNGNRAFVIGGDESNMDIALKVIFMTGWSDLDVTHSLQYRWGSSVADWPGGVGTPPKKLLLKQVSDAYIPHSSGMQKTIYGRGADDGWGECPIQPGTAMGYCYGLSGLYSQPSAVYRHDTYGQFRDILEQKPDTAFFSDNSILDPPIKIKYIARDGTANIDPEMTNTSNLSLYSTSSMPYFDGLARNRATLPPDEDQEMITIA